MNRITTLAVVSALVVLAACGGETVAGDAPTQTVNDTRTEAPTGAEQSSTLGVFATITSGAAASVLTDAPDDLVILDVRTPEEFAEGHLDGAVLVDFYDADFADQLAELDPDVPYLVYCRSGNRSGQTLPLMEQLGFGSAVDIGGGILAWVDAGLPVVAG